ncbi:hypothetical protein R6Q59_019200 [Mikania micrantha]
MEKIEKATKEVLVDIVKMAQKRGMEGSNGGWKEFLSVYDKRFGKSLCDPARRTPEALIAFLKTFSNADDLKFFDRVLEKHESEMKTDTTSPEQELVHKTVAHPHYAMHYSFPSHEEGWVVTKNRKKLKATRHSEMVAVDCEMVLCEDGTDALVRVCVVDRDLKVKLDELVKPNKMVVDYRTSITGLAAKDLQHVTRSLQNIQESMKKLISRGTILVGHSLDNDLLALKMDHTRVIDTSLVFRYWSGPNFRRPSLKDLCKTVLGYELRKEGAPHNCVEDARAAMKLVLAKIEGGVDNNSIHLNQNQNDVHETNAMKLLCHRIPNNISDKSLLQIIPGEFTIELKPSKKAGGDNYSAFAVFKNKQEADEAFEGLFGDQDKDSSGFPQKLVSFKLDSGIAGNLYVRKMFREGDDNNVQVASNKRPSEDEIPTQPKKVKIEEETSELKVNIECNNCDDYLKEIETLKKQLSERDREISMLNKIIVSQVRKQSGL